MNKQSNYDLNSEQEAHDRNKILISSTKSNLPSYCFWMSNDIQKESNLMRLKWWNKQDNTNELVKKWISYLTMHVNK
jgi:hypothetical protein